MGLYGVASVKKTISVVIGGITMDVPINFAEGMVGVIPVFKDDVKAREYVNNLLEDAETFEVQENKFNEDEILKNE